MRLSSQTVDRLLCEIALPRQGRWRRANNTDDAVVVIAGDLVVRFVDEAAVFERLCEFHGRIRCLVDTPAIRDRGRSGAYYYVVYDRVREPVHKSVAKALRAPAFVRESARLLRRLHSERRPIRSIPRYHNCGSLYDVLVADYDSAIRRACNEEEASLLWAFLAANRPYLLDDELVLVHGDLNCSNLLWSDSLFVIDFDLASWGDPHLDLACAYHYLCRRRASRFSRFMATYDDQGYASYSPERFAVSLALFHLVRRDAGRALEVAAAPERAVPVRRGP